MENNLEKLQSFFRTLLLQLNIGKDTELLSELKKKNEEKLTKLNKTITDAEELEGLSEGQAIFMQKPPISPRLSVFTQGV